ncbi:MAG: hypothetical protein JW817_01355 [Clostridiales bacterium]|nr:hypothetical protein [Clostridiales bacterium]
MNKKRFLIIMTLIALVILCSCAKSPADSSTAASSSEAVPTETTLLTGAFGERDLVFSHEGVDVVLLSDVQPLLAALGDGYTLEAAPSCMFDGEDKRFVYSDYEIFTYPIDGMDQIDEIMITDPGYATPRGISVGDAYDEVVAAYGDGTFDDVVLTYILPGGDPESNPRLIFGIQDGRVGYISFYSARNMW